MGTFKLLVRPPLLAALLLAITTQAGCREFAGYGAAPDFQRGAPDQALFDTRSADTARFDATSPPAHWATTCGVSGGATGGASVAVDKEGNAYIAGSVRSASGGGCQGVSVKGDHDVLLLKVRPGGEVAWAKTFGGVGKDGARAVAIAPDGAMYLAGHFFGAVHFDGHPLDSKDTEDNPTQDGFVLRFDSDGTVKWAAQLHAPKDLKVLAMAAENTHIAIGGWFAGPTLELRSKSGTPTVTLGSSGGKDVFVGLLDATGRPQWLAGAEGKGDEAIEAVALAPSGEVYAAGYFDSPTLKIGGKTLTICANPTPGQTSRDAMVIALSSGGTLVGGIALGGQDYEEAHGLTITSDGAPVVVGWSKSQNADFGGKQGQGQGEDDLFIARLNRKADTVSEALLVGSAKPDGAFEVTRLGDSIIVVGTSSGAFSGGTWKVGDGKRILVARLSSKLRIEGLTTAVVGVGAAGEPKGRAWGVAVAPNQELVVTGYFSDSFTPEGKPPQPAAGDEDLFVWRLPAP